jgi:hypothetical protein
LVQLVFVLALLLAPVVPTLPVPAVGAPCVELVICASAPVEIAAAAINGRIFFMGSLHMLYD